MESTNRKLSRAVLWLSLSMALLLSQRVATGQGVATTTVEGTVYLADGKPGSGSLQISWPAFTTSNNLAVAAGRKNVTIGPDGFVMFNLAPNQGSTPAGLYYTAVYHLSDGTTSTEYWIVPAAAQAMLAQVRAQVMPAAQAVQAVSKGYVDQSIQELTQSLLTASGGSLTGPLFLNGDPSQPSQAANKRYVDAQVATALPLSGGAASGLLTGVQLGAAYQVDQFPGLDFGLKLQACLNRLDGKHGGTCDARNFGGDLSMGSNVVIATANATVQLPCATIATGSQIRITAGTRNVALHGCASRGSSNASGSQGGTVFLYSGTGTMLKVGDESYASDTLGFLVDNVVINTTAASSGTAQGMAFYRTQEVELSSLYLLGNSNQTGITLDGTGNYTGGTLQDVQLGGFGTAIAGIGHQVANGATTDGMNASTFLRVHINCPTSGGTPVAGTYGIDLQQGDGNTFTGGDIEGCATALHLGPKAQNNTIVGLRNENSLNQVVADAGSSYNNWVTGGTMFTGQLTDNGTRNSFLDTFHRSFNGLNGDWYGSQKDDTVTNHYRIGIGSGHERGLLNRYQTDYGYRWTTGLSDGTAGEQFYQVLDELNNVYRLSVGQYNQGESSTNNQTVVNAAGTGAVVLNGSANSGTGGVIFGAGGSSGTAVASINNAGNAQFNGSLQVGGASTFTNSTSVKNQADAEIDSFLWAGATTNQKESFTYKDYAGASQWYMVKDASNNWALNSAPGGLDSFKAYQSTNSGDTYVNASNPSGHIRLNYETGSGAETDIYSGSSSGLVAAFLGATAIKFPGLAAASGRNCLQIDNSGYLSNTGTGCNSGANGTVNVGNAGQVAYYTANGTTIAGMSAVAVTAGGTGAISAAQALQNLGGQQALTGVSSDGNNGITVTNKVTATTLKGSHGNDIDITAPPYNAKCDGTTDDSAAIQAVFDTIYDGGFKQSAEFPAASCKISIPISYRGESFHGVSITQSIIIGPTANDVFSAPDKSDNPARFCCAAGTRVHDITVKVDASSDPNGTALWAAKGRSAGQGSVYANLLSAWNGQTILGAMNSGDTSVSLTVPQSITNYHSGYAREGWVQIDSEFIHYSGYANTGCPNSGTFCLLNLTRGITLAGAASTAASHGSGAAIKPVNPLAPANTTDWLPAWTVGACAFAFPSRNGAVASGTPFLSGFVDHVAIAGFNNPTHNDMSTCGFYFQAKPYTVRMEHIYMPNQNFGIVQAPAFINEDSWIGGASGGSSDGNEFKSLEIHATKPFIWYIGGNNTLENSIFYATGATNAAPANPILHPYFCHSGCISRAPFSWKIHEVYTEPNTFYGPDFPPNQQIAGSSHTFENGSMLSQGAQSGIYGISWDANSSTVNTMQWGFCPSSGVQGVQIYGAHNKFYVPNYSPASCWNDLGVDNKVGYISVTGSSLTNLNPYQATQNTLTHDFLTSGNTDAASHYFQSRDDLFWGPDRMMGGSPSNGIPVSILSGPTADSTAPVTGKYAAIPSSGISTNDFFFDVAPRVGQTIPASKGVFHWMVRTPSGSTQIKPWVTTTHQNPAINAVCAVTTTWTDCQIPYDLSASSIGDLVHFTTYVNGAWSCSSGNTCSNPAQEVDMAWFAFVPDMVNPIMDAATVLAKPIASFVPASSSNKGMIQTASNGASATDCTIGGGSNLVTCVSNGTMNVSVQGSAQAYPGSGIANSNGSGWGTSYSTNGSGTVIPLATNPSIASPIFTGNATIAQVTQSSTSTSSFTNTTPAATVNVANFLGPNATSGGGRGAYVCFGSALSNFNSGCIQHVNAGGAGSSSNYMNFGLFGFGAAGLNLFSTGVSIGSTAAPPASGLLVSGNVNLGAGGVYQINGSQVGTIASGTSVLGTSAIASGSCAAAVTTGATGAATSDSIAWAFNAAPGAGYTSGLTILPYVTAGNVNFLVCNPTAGSVTPAAATLNWRIVR